MPIWPTRAQIPTPKPDPVTTGSVGSPWSGTYQNPMEGMNFFQRLQWMAQNRPEVLTDIGSGLMAGKFGAGMAQAGQDTGQYRIAEQKLQTDTASKNATYQWLISMGLSDADAQAAMLNPTILTAMLKQKGYGEDKYYGTPIYGVDSKTGKTGIGTFDKQGNFKVIDTGSFDVTPGVKTYDTATEVITIDTKDGTILHREPKNVAEGAAQAKEGASEGEARALLRSMNAKMPGLLAMTGELKALADKATYTAGGQLWNEIIKQTGATPREAAVARTAYMSKVDNEILPLLRDTFGAQFTEREGTTLRATLGSWDMTPEEKKAVLDSFIEAKKRQILSLQLQTQPDAGSAPRKKYNPKTGKVE